MSTNNLQLQLIASRLHGNGTSLQVCCTTSDPDQICFVNGEIVYSSLSINYHLLRYTTHDKRCVNTKYVAWINLFSYEIFVIVTVA